MLKRAIRTLWLALEELDPMWLPVDKSWRLNERHYGALQGLNKAETAAKFGEAPGARLAAQLRRRRRRRSRADDPRREAGSTRATRGARGAAHRMPEGHRRARAAVLERRRSRRPCAPAARVLVAAHGNSLRALIKYLDAVSDADIVGLNVPTGVPLVYELDAALRPLGHRYLGDAAEIARRVAAVSAQGKAKA